VLYPWFPPSTSQVCVVSLVSPFYISGYGDYLRKPITGRKSCIFNIFSLKLHLGKAAGGRGDLSSFKGTVLSSSTDQKTI